METSSRGPLVDEHLGETTLIHQPSSELEDLLCVSGLREDDGPLADGTFCSPSACTPSHLPSSLLDQPVRPSDPQAPGTSTGCGRTDCPGTGDSDEAGFQHHDSNNGDPDGSHHEPPKHSSSRRRRKPPAAKCHRVRPKEQLDSLQEQVHAIMQKVQALTLVNQVLHRKNGVLSTLLQCADSVEQLSAEALQHHEAFLHRPDAPHEGNAGAVIGQLTLEQFGGSYDALLGEAARWAVPASELELVLAEAAGGELALANQRWLDYLTTCGTLRPDLLEQARSREALHLSSRATSEEEHWLGILHTLQLQPEQEARMLLAREIFLRCIGHMKQGHAGVGPEPPAGMTEAGGSDDYGACLDNQLMLEHVLHSMATSRNLAMVMGHWLFLHTLTPLQTAKAALHSHPIVPQAVPLLNALALDVERRNSHGGLGTVGQQAVQGQQQALGKPLPVQHSGALIS